jgi:hypothetical protein
MANDSYQAREDERTSGFPAHEGPSFCSRPTPVVPLNPHTLERESARPRQSTPSVRPSDRPTFVPDDYIEPRLESPPSVTIDGPTPLEGEDAAASAEAATAALPPLSLSPSVVPVPPPLPKAETTRAASRSGGRLFFARFLFIVLFGAVGTLLAYAFKPRLAGALEHVRAGGTSVRANAE